MSTKLVLTDTRTVQPPAVMGRPFRPNAYRVVLGVAYLALTNRVGDVIAEVAIDVDDLDKALSRRWSLHVITHQSGTQFFYARHNTRRGGETVVTYLHRLLTDAHEGMVVDHIDRNTLDCRQSNMRLVTPAANSQNRSAHSPKNPTGLKNVRLIGGKYVVRVAVDGTEHSCGRFETLEEAASAADTARAALHPYFVGDQAELRKAA